MKKIMFSERFGLEQAVLDTIDEGVMTGDLAALCGCAGVDTQTFLDAVRARLSA